MLDSLQFIDPTYDPSQAEYQQDLEIIGLVCFYLDTNPAATSKEVAQDLQLSMKKVEFYIKGCKTKCFFDKNMADHITLEDMDDTEQYLLWDKLAKLVQRLCPVK